MGATTPDLEDRWHDTLFSVCRSIRYHQRRRAFYDRLDKASNMLSLIFGSATIYGILQENKKEVALLASAFVTVLSSVNLVIGSAQRGRDHTDFMRKYIELEKRMLASPTEQLLLEVQAARLSIEAEEPPVMHVLNSICHNDMVRARGYPEHHFLEIGYIQALLSQVWDVGVSSIKYKKPEPEPTP
jgi:hypothetical protein